MNREDFKNKYSEKFYLGDGLYVRFDGYHFILITERENSTHWVGLEPNIFDQFIEYRKSVYEDSKRITDNSLDKE